MKIAIVGSGISGILVAKTFLEANYEVYLYDANNLRKKNLNKKKLSFLPQTKISPKYEDPLIKKGISQFKKNYRVKIKNFFLASPLITGGMSNFWGGGIEIPEDSYLRKNSYNKKILKEKKNLNYFLNLKSNIFQYYKNYFDQSFNKKLLKKKNKNIYFKKLGICAGQNEANLIFNSSDKIKSFKNSSLFKYIPNKFIKDIKKENGKFILFGSNNKKIKMKFNKVILSTGTIGSTLLIAKILRIKNDIRLYHTPAFKLVYFNPFLIFKKNITKLYKHPLLQLNYKFKNKFFKGSIIHAKNLGNVFFGVKNINFIFSFFKSFLYIGNFFLLPEYSNTYIKRTKKGFTIYSNIKDEVDSGILNVRNNINNFFKKYFFINIPFLNFSKLTNGSDAHYTSTLFNTKINNKKILNKNCEITKLKNLHVLDGSVIAEGLLYPTYFTMLNCIFISKQIINNDKKNKNTHKH